MSEKVDGKTDGAAPQQGGARCGVDSGSATGDAVQLANALRFERAKNEVLLGEVIALEDEVVNRCMADFDAVVSDETREFWREQLLANRDMASAALTELARAKQGLVVAPGAGGAAVTRRPLHNRSLARPMAPAVVGGGAGGGGGSPGANDADDRAAKIRNRAHEISKAERLPFSAAFSRAERELAG